MLDQPNPRAPSMETLRYAKLVGPTVLRRPMCVQSDGRVNERTNVIEALSKFA